MSKSKFRKSKPSGTPQRISRRDFSETHYNGEELPSDMYYAQVANDIFPIIDDTFSAQNGYEPGLSKRIAITLACYVEDLVSETGVWAAFTSLCKKKYGYSIPFHDARRRTLLFPYDPEKPSLDAVRFLLWYLVNEPESEMILNPNNPVFGMLAMVLTGKLQTAYDEAPETLSRPMLLPPEEGGGQLFFQIRALCTWLCDRCYLTRIVNRKRVTGGLDNFIATLFKKTKGTSDREAQKYGLESFVPMNALIGPLALPAYEWLSEMVQLYHEPEEEPCLPILAAMKSRPYSYYRYESVGETEAVLRDLNDKKLDFSTATMPFEQFTTGVEPGKSALLSIVLVDGVWMMNGLALQELPSEVFEEYRRQHREKTKLCKMSYDKLMAALDNERIGVCASYDEFLKRTGASREALAKNNSKEATADLEKAGNLLYFINKNGNACLLPGWAPCVKLKNNPYYNAEMASELGRVLILNRSLTTPEMRAYLIKNKLIPDAAMKSLISPAVGRKLFQRNVAFLNDYFNRDTMPFLQDT